jgi:hypothetical protein
MSWPRGRGTQSQRMIRSVTFAAVINCPKRSNGIHSLTRRPRRAAKAQFRATISGWTSETGQVVWRRKRERGGYFKRVRERSPITLLGAKRKYFSGGCVL